MVEGDTNSDKSAKINTMPSNYHGKYSVEYYTTVSFKVDFGFNRTETSRRRFGFVNRIGIFDVLSNDLFIVFRFTKNAPIQFVISQEKQPS